MSNIPKGREALLKIAENTDKTTARAIRKVITQYLVREPRTRRAPRQSQTITPRVRRQIMLLAKTNPNMPIRKIGQLCGVDGGRVSEVLTGKR